MTIPPPSDPVQAIREAARNADWTQVVLNGGPPCFHLYEHNINGAHFCLRAQRWMGHGTTAKEDHPFVSLEEALSALGSSASPSPASEGRDSIIAKLHNLLAEALRCLADERYDAVRRKVGYADVLVCELEALSAAGSPVLAFQAWCERYATDRGQPLTQDEYFLAQQAFYAAHPGKGPQSSTAGSPVPSSELERLVKAFQAECASNGIFGYVPPAWAALLAWGKADPSSPAGTVEDQQ